MASTIMHLAVAQELFRSHAFSSPARLKFGVILPDAGPQSTSHLKISLHAGRKKTYDLDAFRAAFGERIRQDDLYLGYYLHLVQDVCFRHFLYGQLGWDPHIPGNVDKLHHDYALCNAAVIRAYGLKNDVVIPDGFDREPIHRLDPLDAEALLRALGGYFFNAPAGEASFFTQERAEAYIHLAAEWCRRELDALASGGPLLDAYDNAWNNR